MDELTSLYHLGNSGVPDRLVILPGAKIGFAEMKRDLGGKTSALQDVQIAFLRRLGFLVEVLDSEEDIEEFLEKLQGGDKSA